MNDDSILLVHAAVMAMVSSPDFVAELRKRIHAAVPQKQATNSAMLPCKQCPDQMVYVCSHEFCDEPPPCASKAVEGAPMVPCECAHGEPLEGLCNACADMYGSNYRLVRTAP